MPITMTVPGGAQVDHRRDLGRGRRRHPPSPRRPPARSSPPSTAASSDDGYALAALTASEAGIYGRFGYGAATTLELLVTDRPASRRVRRATAPDPGGVRQLAAHEARELLPEPHDRWQRHTPGGIHRSDLWWEWQLADRPERRRDATALQFLVHADGYATYRAAGEQARLVELFAATPHAHAALWRVLLGLDFADVLMAELAPDDPLPHLLADPRAVTVTDIRDGVWVRLLDVAAALARRRYARELDVVVEVADPFLGRGGRFRLRGGPDGAECARTADPAGARCDVATLGSLFLGGHAATVLHRAGRLNADDPTVALLDDAFRTRSAPRHGTDF